MPRSAAARAALRQRCLRARPGAARRHPHREPGPGSGGLRCAPTSTTRSRRTLAALGFDCRGLRQPAARHRLRAVPGRHAARGRCAAHGADVRPRRRHPRPGRVVDAGPGPVDAGRGRRAALRPRHRRQQGPAQHQHRRAGAGARRARRPARLQRQLADRDRRGDRLARPGRVLRRAARRAGRRRADRQRRPAPARRPADGVPGLARRRQLRPAACKLRDGAHHSGNWGGLLRNPGTVLATAIASLVDGRGRILVPGLRPPPIPANVRAALAGLQVGGGAGRPGHRRRLGRARTARRSNACSPGTRSRCWPCAPATPTSRSTRSRACRRRTCTCASSSAPTSRSCASTCSAPPARARLRRRRGRRAGGHAGHAARPGQRLGALRAGLDRAQHRHRAGAAAQPRRLAAQRRLRRQAWGCPRCGCRTATRPARSTRPTSTCSSRWCARRCS